MADEALHYPPGAEPEAPAPEAPKDEPAPEAPAPEEPAPEAEKPAEQPEEKSDEPTPEVPIKKRSIYDDLKDKKQEAKDYRNIAVAALKAQGIELTGKETPAELQSLMQKHKTPDAPTPPAPEPAAPADDLDAYAKENGLDAKALGRLAEIIAKRVPAAQLSDADRKELSDLKAWKTDNEAKEQRANEDSAIRAEGPKVKEQLQVHDDAELAKVMDEIVKLAHTAEFHDKEVEYIVWKNQAKLAKLVSPKKPSFESGGSPEAAAPDAEPDFSSGKGITPGMAQNAAQAKGSSALEIRKGR